MNIDFGSVGSGNGTFGIGHPPTVESPKAEGKKVGGDTLRPADFRLADLSSFDPLQGSEPVAEVPESAPSRDDDLGRLVSSAFTLPPPPPPTFP